MILCFDFGNTIKKYAFIEGQEIVLLGQLPSFNLDEISEILRNKLISKIIVSSVIDIPDEFVAFLRTIGSLQILSNSDLNPKFSKSDYNLSSLGIDRKLIALGAKYIYPNQNLLIISLGTCITYNFISNEGAFEGGIISPGLVMRAKGMHEFTDQLPLVDWQKFKTDTFFGKNTAENLYHGVVTAACLEIEGFVQKFKFQTPNLRILLCGGDAEFIHSKLKLGELVIDQNLLWKGMVQTF